MFVLRQELRSVDRREVALRKAVRGVERDVRDRSAGLRIDHRRQRRPRLLDEEALRAATQEEAEVLHASEPRRITDLPQAAAAEQVLRGPHGLATRAEMIPRIVSADRAEQRSGELPAAVLLGDDEVRDVVV